MIPAPIFCHGVRPFGVTAVALLAVVATSLAARPARATVYDYTSGHADIGLAYDAGTGPRFFLQFAGDAEASGLTSEQLLAGHN